MKLIKVLEKAKESGITDLVLNYGVSSSLEVTFSEGKHDNTTISNDFSFRARGGVDGHLVSFVSDVLDNKTVSTMIKTMLDQKNYSQSFDSDLIIEKPNLEYAKNKSYFASIKKIQVPELMKIGEELSNAITKIDSRIVNTEVSVQISSGSNEFLNSKGLSLSSKSSYLVLSAQAIAEEDGETVSDYIVKAYTNIKKVKIDVLAKDLAKKLLARLHGKKGVAGTKVCLFKPEALQTITSVMLGHLSMFEVDQKMSLLEGKVDQKVFADCLTIEETPNTNDIFSTSYDSEGYPTSNKMLIEKGVLKTYLYNQEMAKKYNHAPTGNGFGFPIPYPNVTKIKIHHGDKKEKELIKTIEDGYIVTSLSGANAGIDGQTGGFTLSAEGFYVKNGRIKYPVNQFTIGGDVMSFLKNIISVSDKEEELISGNAIPSALVKDIVVSC